MADLSDEQLERVLRERALERDGKLKTNELDHGDWFAELNPQHPTGDRAVHGVGDTRREAMLSLLASDDRLALQEQRAAKIRRVAQIGGSVLALVVLGLFVALLSGSTSIRGATGKYNIEISLAIALIIGWAVGSGVEQLWKDDTPGDDLLFSAVKEILPRLFAGAFLVLIIGFIALGLEELGVGLGPH